MSAVIDFSSARFERRLAPAGNVIFAHDRFNPPHNIDLNLPSALAYWCRQFKTTPERLLDAVRAAGTNPSIVRRLLLKK
jgi:hypothetical protein